MSTLANHDTIQAWSDFQPTMVAAVGEEGDAARRYVLNLVLFELFGERAGKAVLDAGCMIQRVVEPTLTAEGVVALGENQRDLHVPNVMVISATKCVPPSSCEVAHVSIT